MWDWSTFTPDGRRLVVSRGQSGWSVVCGDGSPVEHEILDVALIEAIRKGTDFGSHSMGLDYATWARELADRLELEARRLEAETAGQLLPQKGDRIEFIGDPHGITRRGTVQHVDRVQILVKWDDGRSGGLRVGTDRFRIISS
jgi:hypothetical protein